MDTYLVIFYLHVDRWGHMHYDESNLKIYIKDRRLVVA